MGTVSGWGVPGRPTRRRDGAAGATSTPSLAPPRAPTVVAPDLVRRGHAGDLAALQRRAGNRAVTGALIPVQRRPAGAPGARPMLFQGSSGEAVGVMQQKLNSAGAAPPLVIDASFGPVTLAAVQQFQRGGGLRVDGVVGSMTWGSLDTIAPGGGRDAVAGGEVAVAGPDEADPVAIPDAGTSLHPTVGLGHTVSGPAVEELQQRLNQTGLTTTVVVNGTVDGPTTQAITDFQTANLIAPADGVADPVVWTALESQSGGTTVGRVERTWSENVGGNPNIGMTSRYTWRLLPEDAPDRIEVSANVATTGLAPKPTWPGLVDAAWNRFAAVNVTTGDAIDVVFRLELNGGGTADNTVDVKLGPGRANAAEWFLTDTQEAATIPHEFGHLVGLQDEYQQTAADFQRVTGTVAPVGALGPTIGSASAATVTQQMIDAIGGTGATGVADADALGVVQTHGLVQGAFSQRVAQRYQATAGTDLIADIRALGSANEFFIVEPFTYSSGSIMGDSDPGRNHLAENPHDHGVQPRHVREFIGYIRAWGTTQGLPDTWEVV